MVRCPRTICPKHYKIPGHPVKIMRLQWSHCSDVGKRSRMIRFLCSNAVHTIALNYDSQPNSPFLPSSDPWPEFFISSEQAVYFTYTGHTVIKVAKWLMINCRSLRIHDLKQVTAKLHWLPARHSHLFEVCPVWKLQFVMVICWVTAVSV